MKKIKYLILCLISFSLGFYSCNKNEAVPTYIPLSIIETFDPLMKEIVISEIQDLAPYQPHVFVVNSIADLPDDEVFGNDELINKNIDFSQYSLIIFYNLQFGKVLSTGYRWGYNTDFNQYQVTIGYEIEKGSDNDEKFELATYMKGAILVDHIPSSSEVLQMIGVNQTLPD